MKTFLKRRGDLKPCWNTCSKAQTRPYSPHSRRVRLPLYRKTDRERKRVTNVVSFQSTLVQHISCGHMKLFIQNTCEWNYDQCCMQCTDSVQTEDPLSPSLWWIIDNVVGGCVSHLLLWLVEVLHYPIDGLSHSLLDLTSVQLWMMGKSKKKISPCQQTQDPQKWSKGMDTPVAFASREY